MEIPALMELSPHIEPKIWGGSKLKSKKALKEDQVGETWEVSALPEGPSLFQGKGLHQLGFADLPYLVKFIDTIDTLSVQVHPGDEFAQKHENTLGKDECWLIVEAGVGAGVYLGLTDDCQRSVLEELLKNKEDLTPYLHFYPVKKGDFFYVPAGTVHAIGKNVTLLEVQKSSGITYRLWDWNRVEKKTGKGRTLDIAKGIQVAAFGAQKNDKSQFQYQGQLLQQKKSQRIFAHAHFFIEHFYLEAQGEKIISLQGHKKASAMICIEGAGLIKKGQSQKEISAYKTVFMPILGEKEFTLSASQNSHYILVGHV